LLVGTAVLGTSMALGWYLLHGVPRPLSRMFGRAGFASKSRHITAAASGRVHRIASQLLGGSVGDQLTRLSLSLSAQALSVRSGAPAGKLTVDPSRYPKVRTCNLDAQWTRTVRSCKLPRPDRHINFVVSSTACTCQRSPAAQNRMNATHRSCTPVMAGSCFGFLQFSADRQPKQVD